jgi:E3 ubiquitin-protein ligase ATL6/9/15/31/42/55
VFDHSYQTCDIHAKVIGFTKINIYQKKMINMKNISLFTLLSFNRGQAWLILSLVITLVQILPLMTGQPLGPEDPTENNKSVATIIEIVAVMTLFSSFLSLYSSKCGDRQRGVIFDLSLPTGGSGLRAQNNEPSNGLNQDVIDTFPTFRYSNVKGLKIGKSTLACAVCLNEFQDDETLRLIPKCSHVYHHGCIDIWLVSHNTCPVCRANLDPRSDDTIVPPSTIIQIPEGEIHHNEEVEHDIQEEQKRDNIEVEYSTKVNLLRRSHTYCASTRSRSTGFLSVMLLSRSNSTGVLVQPGEDCERFTLRLPDEVRHQMMINTTTHKRAKSCVSFTRMSSGTCGYRSKSVGCGSGWGHMHYERFGSEEEENLGFARNSWNNKSIRKSPLKSLEVNLNNYEGELSSDLLFPV